MCDAGDVGRSTTDVGALTLQAQVTLREQPDRALLQGVRHGDERAFEELFLRHYAGVQGVALRIVGDVAEAEEIAGDVFLKLYRRPIADSDDANVRAWLYRVATNAAFNAVRSRRRRLGWLQRLAQRADTGGSDHDDPSSIVADRDEARIVREHLARLPDRQRTALVLRSSGLTYAEIASALDVNVTSVGTILARAERAFRKIYDAEADRRPDGGSGA